MRVGAMFYYRTNRDQLGTRNEAVPTSRRTRRSRSVPNGPNGATTADHGCYNLPAALASASNNIRDNRPELDTNTGASSSPPRSASRRAGRWSPV